MARSSRPRVVGIVCLCAVAPVLMESSRLASQHRQIARASWRMPITSEAQLLRLRGGLVGGRRGDGRGGESDRQSPFSIVDNSCMEGDLGRRGSEAPDSCAREDDGSRHNDEDISDPMILDTPVPRRRQDSAGSRATVEGRGQGAGKPEGVGAEYWAQSNDVHRVPGTPLSGLMRPQALAAEEERGWVRDMMGLGSQAGRVAVPFTPVTPVILDEGDDETASSAEVADARCTGGSSPESQESDEIHEHVIESAMQAQYVGDVQSALCMESASSEHACLYDGAESPHGRPSWSRG